MRERLKGLWQVIIGMGGLLVVAVFGMALFGIFDDEAEEIGNAEIFKGNDTKSVFSGETEIEVVEVEKEQEVKKESESDNDTYESGNDIQTNDIGIDYAKEGDIRIGNGLILTLDKVDIEVLPNLTETEMVKYLYVITEIENTSDELLYVSQGQANLYIDDYQYDADVIYPITIDGETYDNSAMNVNPRRKTKYTFYLELPDEAINSEKLEYEIFGLPILIKYDGEWLVGLSDTTKEVAETGTTLEENSDGSISAIVAGEYISTSADTNAIITITDDGYMGISFVSERYDFDRAELIDNGDGLYQANGCGVVYTVTFYEDGLFLYNNEVDFLIGFFERVD